MLSRTRIIAAAAVVVVAACEDAPPFAPQFRPAPDIVDARSGGTPGFHFLPPIAPAPADIDGALDAALLAHLSVEVCGLDAGACAGAPVASFSAAGTGSARLRVEQDEGEHFHVVWHTGAGPALDPDRHYRIRVLVAGTQIGYADVDVVKTGNEAKGVDRSRWVAVQKGSSLPIKFHIALGALGVVGSVGGTAVLAGGRVSIDVPAGSVDGPTAFTATPVADYPADGVSVVGGTVYDFGPEGLVFDPPVSVTIAYDPAALGGADESQLQLHKLVDGSWHPVAGSTVDAAANTVTTPLSGFSPYGIIIVTPTGLALSGWGTPTVDGAILAGEWSGAAQLAFQANLPGGGTAPATLFVMNDAARVYLAVRIERAAADAESQVSFTMDPGNDGTSAGDDQVAVQLSSGLTFEIDAFMNPGCGSFCADQDTAFGGTADVAGAVGNNGVHTVMEVSQPLNSGDTGRDIAAAAGDLIGLGTFVVLHDGSGWGFTSVPAGPITLQILVAAPPSAAVPVSAGYFHTCGVTPGGAGYCWGANGYGGLGDGSITVREAPTAVLGGLSFTAISAGEISGRDNWAVGAHSCGLTASGAAYCWGLNQNGQLGNGTTTSPNSSPIAVAGGLSFKAISAGRYFTCALTTAGAAYCWGANSYGRLGNGATTGVYSTPTAVIGGHVFGSISAGGEHACGVTTTGAVYCWGANGYGQLGTGTQGGTSGTPVQAAAFLGLTFAAVSAGSDHTCGLTTTGAAYCWGAGGYGELGNGATGVSASPVAVSGGLAFKAIEAGSFTQSGFSSGGHTCALTTSGAAYCWGMNGYGQLGTGSSGGTSTVPVAVSGGHTFRALAAGEAHSCAVATSGTLYCWGHNAYGQLGDGTRTVANAPKAVLGGLIF